MKASTITTFVVVAVVIIGAVYWFSKPGASAQRPSPATAAQNQVTAHTAPVTPTVTPPITASTSTPSPITATSSTPAKVTAQSFTINASDSSADLTTINVSKDTPVQITFKVSANNTYHGGLDFKSSVVSTGTILPGKSKTISFTAAKSFAFTPYWPATNTKKPYLINIVVK